VAPSLPWSWRSGTANPWIKPMENPAASLHVPALGVGNSLLAFSLSKGVKISWWRRALKGGTICNLHHYWAMGVGPMSAITAGRYFHFVGLATLIVAVSFRRWFTSKGLFSHSAKFGVISKLDCEGCPTTFPRVH